MKIIEVNPNTSKGSYGKGLNLARLWSLINLKKVKTDFDTIYIVGSWYSNISIMFHLLRKYFSFNKIINVESDKKRLIAGQKIVDKIGIDNIEPMYADANELDYRQLGNNGLVICFSCTNIRGREWFNNIPKGTLVMLQARDNDPGAVNNYISFDDFSNEYPMSKTLLLDEIQLEDPQTEYNCWLKIGVK